MPSDSQGAPDIESRLRMLETRASVADTHHDLLAQQMGDMTLALRDMHRDLREQLIAAAEHRSKNDERLANHIADEEEWRRAAFPQGDPDAHRREHEQRSTAEAASAALWRDIRRDLIRDGARGGALLLLGLLTVGGLAMLAAKLGIKWGGP